MRPKSCGGSRLNIKSGSSHWYHVARAAGLSSPLTRLSEPSCALAAVSRLASKLNKSLLTSFTPHVLSPAWEQVGLRGQQTFDNCRFFWMIAALTGYHVAPAAGLSSPLTRSSEPSRAIACCVWPHNMHRHGSSVAEYRLP
jgi:hypothetical protein